MLSPAEQTQVRESLARVEARAYQALERTCDPWQAMGFVKSVHSSIDDLAATLGQTSPLPECKAGCSYCCGNRVSVSDPEALQLATHVRSLPGTAQARLTLTLKLRAAQHADASLAANHPCAFLAAGHCTVYAIRPAVCRKAHSLSAQACASGQAVIPQKLDLLLQAEVVIAGSAAAYRRRGLSADFNELSTAVLAALKQTDSAERWFQGEPLVAEP